MNRTFFYFCREIIESIVQKDKCVVVGQNGTYLSDSVELLNSKICNSSSLCASWDRAGCLVTIDTGQL